MVVEFKLNGVKVTKDLATRWDEVSFRQFLDMAKAGEDKTRVVSILTGIEYETLLKAKIGNLETLLAITSFVWTEPIDYILPKSLTILGSLAKYKIDDNLELNSLERYSDLDNVLKSFGDDSHKNLEKYPLICATYAVSPYDYKDAENLANEFFNSPCTEVMAVGNFTLVSIRGLKNIIPTIVPLEDTRLNRLRLALRNWGRYLGYMAHYYLWRKTLPLPVRRYFRGR